MSLYIPLLLISSLARFESDAQVKVIRQRVQKADAACVKQVPERFLKAADGALGSYEKFALGKNAGHKLVYNDKDLDGGSAIKWYYLGEAGKPYFIYQYSSSPVWAEDGEGPNLKRHQELRCYFHEDSLLYAWTKEQSTGFYAKPELSKVPLAEAEACQDLQTQQMLESSTDILGDFSSPYESSAYSLKDAALADADLARLLGQVKKQEQSLDASRRETLTEQGDGGSETKYTLYWQGKNLRAVEVEGSYEDSEWNSTWYLDANGELFYYAKTAISRYVCSPVRETCPTGRDEGEEMHLFFQNGEFLSGLSRSYEAVPLDPDGASPLQGFPFAALDVDELSSEERDPAQLLQYVLKDIEYVRGGQTKEEPEEGAEF